MKLFDIVKAYFGNYLSSSSKLMKRIKDCNNDLKIELNEFLNKNIKYEKLSYLIIAICKDISLKHCLTCGKILTYSKGKDHDYCCNRCAQLNVETRNKIEQTNLRKYEYITPAKNNKVKDKIKKTNLKKYGVNCTLKSENILSRFKKISEVKLDPFADTHIENDPTYSNQGGPMNAWRFNDNEKI